jgi:hypothetical protein
MRCLATNEIVRIKECVNACFKNLIKCASGARARVNPLGPWRNAAVKTQLAESQGCGLVCAYDENFCG